MAKGKEQQAPQKPANDAGDFSKFLNSALDSMVVTDPAGAAGEVGPPADGLPVNLPPAARQQMQQGQVPTKTVPSNQNIVDQTQAAYQAMLRDEEARLAALPKRAMSVLPNPGSAMAAGTLHSSVSKLVVRDGCPVLLPECYEVLQRVVASGMMPPFGDLWTSIQDLMLRVRKEIEGEKDNTGNQEVKK
jgi:uncharacterized protein YbaR (Trm112 family)